MSPDFQQWKVSPQPQPLPESPKLLAPWDLSLLLPYILRQEEAAVFKTCTTLFCSQGSLITQISSP